MPYKNKTSYFGIPVISKGEKLQSEDELVAMNIIENQLLAGMKGVKCSIFEEGYYKLIDNNDGTYAVSLMKSSANYALCAIIGGAYAETQVPIVWDGLQVNSTYYLYLQYTDTLFQDPTSFRVVFSNTKKTDNNGLFLLLASVDLTGTNRIVNNNPDGKIYSNDVAVHVNDVENPHSANLTQDVLNVTKKLNVNMNDLDGGINLLDNRTDKTKNKAPTIQSNSDLIFKDSKNEATLSEILGSINDLNLVKNKVMQIKSGGKNGVLITIDEANEIDFVNFNVLKIANDENFANIGDIIVGYNLIDNSVSDKKSFKIYNNGDLNIDLKISVVYR